MARCSSLLLFGYYTTCIISFTPWETRWRNNDLWVTMSRRFLKTNHMQFLGDSVKIPSVPQNLWPVAPRALLHLRLRNRHLICHGSVTSFRAYWGVSGLEYYVNCDWIPLPFWCRVVIGPRTLLCLLDGRHTEFFTFLLVCWSPMHLFIRPVCKSFFSLWVKVTVSEPLIFSVILFLRYEPPLAKEQECLRSCAM